MAKYQVCSRCEGEGKIVNPVLSVWTQSDIEENPDGFEDMLAGLYDVTCPACRGLRVVTPEDEERYAEEVEDRRTQALESGDWEGYSNPY